MRDSFSWAATRELRELDNRGRPNLYYANIYVHKREQLELLERLRVHYSFRPLLAPELARFRGKCGSTNYSGDGEGIFVFAVISGFQYNLIRSAGLAPDASADPLLFRAVILRDIPQSIRNPFDGFSYEKLAQAGFKYRVPTGFQDKEITQGFLDDLVETVGGAIEDVGNAIAEGLGAVDAAVSGTVQITMDLTILNRDSRFGRTNPMHRAWGPRTGDELAVDDLRTEIFTAALVIVPELSVGTTNDIGVAHIDVPDGSEGVSICWELDNHAAFLGADWNNYDICDRQAGRGARASGRSARGCAPRCVRDRRPRGRATHETEHEHERRRALLLTAVS